MSKIGFFFSGVGLVFLLTCLAFLVVIAFWMVLVCRSSGGRRKRLLAAGLTVIGLAAVLFGGNVFLGIFELTWRQWLKNALAFLMWCGGWVVCFLTVYWNSAAFRKSSKIVRRCTQMLLCLCMLVAMGLGTFFGGAWLYSGGEFVAQWNGDKIVMVEEHFLDDVCIYYEYHGPFVRGSKPIGPIGG